MQRVVLWLALVLLSGSPWTDGAAAQALRTEVPDVSCSAELGVGVLTKRTFCDVLTAGDPSEGIIIRLPPHRGDLILTFDLHNRHTFSEEQMQAGRAYAHYTATVDVLTMDRDLIARAIVQSEFRTADDLVDRVAGGAGPTGLKAIAPAGTEPIVVRVPQDVDAVSLIGERLELRRLTGPEVYTAAGRAVAVISNVLVEYTPAPAPTRRR